ncbi:MAG: DUF4399 domain-containing protein [Sphingobacteriales bacterium]|nr:DUF4399 domain-containing protein [Sphingobacteriales bacterium]
MERKLILAILAVSIFTACNNSSDNKEKKEDTTMKGMEHDSMQHMPTTSANIPALPVIPDGAKVFFRNLKNGASVSSPFKVEMGTEVMKVDTAGPVVAGSGHHHLIIDGADSLMAGEMVSKDSTHLHFGKGQTETELTLAPGKHKLTMQFADGLHRSYGGKLSATITVNVKQ